VPDAVYEIERTTLDWLLEPDDAGVRVATLRCLMGRSATDPELVIAEADINQSVPVKTLLDLQGAGACWGTPKSFYTGKYSSTVWTLLVLAELGATADDERIRAACSFILKKAWHRDSGGFSQRGGPNGGQGSGVIPCLTGNMLWVLIRFGYLDDPRVQSSIEWFCHYQRFDDGDGLAPTGWPYDNWEICWGRHSCHMGVVKMLKAFSEIPEKMRPGWKKFGFPLMYQTDALEILNILLDLGYRDPRMNEAAELVRSKQGEDGRWRLENSYNQSLLVPIERKDASSKWVTLNALRALKRYSYSTEAVA